MLCIVILQMSFERQLDKLPRNETSVAVLFIVAQKISSLSTLFVGLALTNEVMTAPARAACSNTSLNPLDCVDFVFSCSFFLADIAVS